MLPRDPTAVLTGLKRTHPRHPRSREHIRNTPLVSMAGWQIQASESYTYIRHLYKHEFVLQISADPARGLQA